MSCSQLIEIEDLVLGTAEPARAKQLRAHVEGCTACRLEQVAVVEERALFARRASALAVPPASLAGLLRAQLTAEVAAEAPLGRPSVRGLRVGPARRGAERLVRRGASALGAVLRRGHGSAACAALLFALVAFSKLGGAPILPLAEPEVASEDQANGPTASFSSASRARDDETLACSLGESMMTTRDDQLVSSGAPTQSSSNRPAIHDELVCGRSSALSSATCEPSVTLSSRRQMKN